MVFTKLITFVFVLSSIKAIMVAETNVISPRSVSPMVHLMPRALPPCPKFGFSAEVPSEATLNAAIAEDEAYAAKSYAWEPKSCALGGQNCVKTPSVAGARMNMATVAPITHTFEIPDEQAVIYLIPNGYPTFQWTAPGGTVNSYMAHGTDYILVRGWALSVEFWDGVTPKMEAPGQGNPDITFCSQIPDGDKTIVYNPDAPHNS
ncbi:uncharacterized protein MELLADRAFT_102446 [Melampsora larici-populina 98AG31]|uniref:Secreted protein n=1 Tax=Melampsora larici-populina (strain 98AG31 / pathotype 3-4-7) TaxID=747676 RepID=F4R8C3_MELLP|nr:uncharacterized protein MELLADRAFT_102446 [Melampsora larici-populina 98AG31]EGG11465.1 secreted protein [Melampsora larici-populina 98AG31]